MSKLRENIESIEDMYLNQHLTMKEIGHIFGVTRQAVYKTFKHYDIPTVTAERFSVPCDYCNKEFETTRKVWKSSMTHYCSQGCYHAHRSSITPFEGRPNKHGMRIARKVMEIHLKRPLKDGEVVHHEDKDNTNNHIDNLILFVSQSEHLRYHHQKRIASLI
jgi:hypothetical protein